ncbi:MAG: hypothetical protein PHI71_08450 [Acidiphilium sp.]|nr:hypothetical protein [Acidiphilium sp.]
MTTSTAKATSLSYTITGCDVRENTGDDVTIIDDVSVDATVEFSSGKKKTYSLVGNLCVCEHEDRGDLPEIFDDNARFLADIAGANESFTAKYEEMLAAIAAKTGGSTWEVVKHNLSCEINNAGDVICRARVITNKRNTAYTDEHNLRFRDGALLDRHVTWSDADNFERGICVESDGYKALIEAVVSATSEYAERNKVDVD